MPRTKGTGNHGVKISWTADNDRKLLLSIIDKSKSYDVKELATLFPGGTTKAIEERIAKLKREANALLKSVGIDVPPTLKRKATSKDVDGSEVSSTPKRKAVKSAPAAESPSKRTKIAMESKLENRQNSSATASLYPPPARDSELSDDDDSDDDSEFKSDPEASENDPSTGYELEEYENLEE
ncbi:MAG: hypothetical protein M1839_009220 [Geoglossum umbratile]|nr:MAG: hypothetical protein M1839_009220 [Geoglossum umbratile]